MLGTRLSVEQAGIDADGCTGQVVTPHNSDIVAVGFSVAQINNNTITVRDFNGDIDSYVRILPNIGGSGTKHYIFPQTNRSNLLATATFTMARFFPVTGETFELNDRCDPGGNNCCDCSNEAGIWVSRRTRKFLIAHEVGHALLRKYAGVYNNDCTREVDDMLPCFSTSGHAIAGLADLQLPSLVAVVGFFLGGLLLTHLLLPLVLRL